MGKDGNKDTQPLRHEEVPLPHDWGAPIRDAIETQEKVLGKAITIKRQFKNSMAFIVGHTRDLINTPDSNPDEFQAIKEFGLERFGYVHNLGDREKVLEVDLDRLLSDEFFGNEQALKEFVQIVWNEVAQDNNGGLVQVLEMQPTSYETKGLTTGLIRQFIHKTEPYFQENAHGAKSMLDHNGFRQAVEMFPGLGTAVTQINKIVPLTLARTLPPNIIGT